MTREIFEELMKNENMNDGFFYDLKDDNAVLGLQIIRKYLPTKGIEGAEHDVIYSVGVDDILEAGITEEDTKMLRISCSSCCAIKCADDTNCQCPYWF